MNKENTQWFLAGLFIGLVIVGGVFALFQPTPKISSDEKMKECIKSGGQYQVMDWSLRDDGSEYKATCKIPQRYLWKIDY